jgi:hypothetical protein
MAQPNGTWPLSHSSNTFTGKSPSATTDEAQKYKDMLGFQAAGEDVGLFYQLNQTAAAEPEEPVAYGNSKSRQSQNIANYGNDARPIEAGGVYS